jgi:hypothetical protein
MPLDAILVASGGNLYRVKTQFESHLDANLPKKHKKTL